MYNGRQGITVLVNSQARTKGTEMFEIYQAIYLFNRNRDDPVGLEPNIHYKVIVYSHL